MAHSRHSISSSEINKKRKKKVREGGKHVEKERREGGKEEGEKKKSPAVWLKHSS